MPATVYYADMHCRSHEDSKIAKVTRLCEALNLKKIIKKKELTAVKLHFGEYGNDTHLNPTRVCQVVDKIMVLPGFPWVTPVRNWPGRGLDRHRRSRWLS